jgi:hypothetical protein
MTHTRKLGIESLESRTMLATYSVNQVNDFGNGTIGSLSWAINSANQAAALNPADPQVIRFNISSSQPVVDIRAELPTITAPLFKVEGANFGNNQEVQLRHNSSQFYAILRYIGDDAHAGHFEVRNLEITNFNLGGIVVESLSDDDRVTIFSSTLRNNQGFGSGTTGAISIFDIPSGPLGKVEITGNRIYSNDHGIVWAGPAAVVSNCARCK